MAVMHEQLLHVSEFFSAMKTKKTQMLANFFFLLSLISTAKVAYFGGTRSSGEGKWPGLSLWLLCVPLLPLLSNRLQTGLL